MAEPVSTRYLPVRDALLAALQGWPALAGVKRWVTQEGVLAQTAASQAPAVGVFYAPLAGEERLSWAGGGRDHSYYLEVRLVVRSLDSQECEDTLFAYAEAVEDAVRADPTLGGRVRFAALGSLRRVAGTEGNAFLGQGVVEVSCEERVE